MNFLAWTSKICCLQTYLFCTIFCVHFEETLYVKDSSKLFTFIFLLLELLKDVIGEYTGLSSLEQGIEF